MHNHFDQHLNVRELILGMDPPPKLVVEIGAGGGENTRNLIALAREVKFDLAVIDDNPSPFDDKEGKDLPYGRSFAISVDEVRYGSWIQGVSYDVLHVFVKDGIDFCLLDTDHNYWTMDKELDLLKKKIRVGGIIAIHDTETYAHNDTGIALSYRNGASYPLKEIQQASKGKGLRDAIDKYVMEGYFEVIAATRESQGAMALRRI